MAAAAVDEFTPWHSFSRLVSAGLASFLIRVTSLSAFGSRLSLDMDTTGQNITEIFLVTGFNLSEQGIIKSNNFRREVIKDFKLFVCFFKVFYTVMGQSCAVAS